MFRKLILASAVSLALPPATASALGLGDLRAESALNQPFIAEIELIDARPDELDTVKAVLASEAEFAKVGTERYYYLTQLRFEPQVSPEGRTVLRVSSREPIREPFLNFLVEVNWPAGRLVREYAVLLDPPVTQERRAARAVRPPAVSRAATAGAGETLAAATPAGPLRSGPIRVPAAADTATFPSYSEPVPKGAGLLQVARRLAPAGATVPQTALALYRSNQGAFIGGNINRLRAGETLVLPSAAELFALDAETARQDLAAAVRGREVARAPLTDGRTQTVAAEAAGGRLQIAGASPPAQAEGQATAATGPAPLEQELLLIRETSESTRQETEDLRGRIHQLEAQLADIQNLLALRNEQLAELQLAQAIAAEEQPISPVGLPTGATGPSPDVSTPPIATPADAALEAVAEAPMPPPAAETEPDAATAVAVSAPIELGAPPSAEAPAASDSAAEIVRGAPLAPPGEAGTPTAPTSPIQTPAPEASPSTPAGAKAPEPAQIRPTPEAIAPTAKPATRPWPLVGLGAGVFALLGASAWYLVRRRRRLATSLHVEGTLPETGGAAPEPVPAAPAQGQATAARSRPPIAMPIGAEEPSSTTPSGSAALRPFDEESEVDVFSEADIYIAYGRYREAEALLREEVHRAPERLDLQFKLAEALFGMKKYEAFDALLDRLAAAGAEDSHPEHWRRLVAMQSSLAQARPDAAANEDGAERHAAARPPLEATSPRPLRSIDSGEAEGLGPAADKPDTGPHRAAPMAAPSSPATAADSSFFDMDLDLDTLASSVSGRRAPEMDQVPNRLAAGQGASADGPARPEIDLDLDLGELKSIEDFDWDGLAGGGARRQGTATADARPMPRLELDLDDLVGAGSAETAGLALDLDIAGLGDTTDRPPGPGRTAAGDGEYSGAGATDRAAVPTPFAIEDDGLGGVPSAAPWQQDSDLWDEVATKLDLARAYLDMKETEAARAILEEIAEEGNDAQRTEAKQLIERLA